MPKSNSELVLGWVPVVRRKAALPRMSVSPAAVAAVLRAERAGCGTVPCRWAAPGHAGQDPTLQGEFTQKHALCENNQACFAAAIEMPGLK